MPIAFDGQYRVDSPQGKKALEQLRSVTLGGEWEYPLIPSLPTKAKWKLLEHKKIGEDEIWEIYGYFCSIPFYRLKIQLKDQKLSMVVE